MAVAMSPSVVRPAASVGAPIEDLSVVGAPMGGGPDLAAALQAVVSTISMSLNYRTAVINVYRPAFDEFEVLAVHGGDEVRRTLLHQRTSAEQWRSPLRPEFARRGAYFIPAGAYDWGD